MVARRNGVDVESIVLWLLGGAAQLRSEPTTPRADFRIAVVGPLTSLVLAVGFGAVGMIASLLGAEGLPIGVLAYLAGTNLLLAIFNLLPAAPLDGGRVLRAALWRWRGDREQASVAAARAGQVFGFVLIGLGLLQVLAAGGIGGLWLALIGWFLVNAATAEEQQARLSSRLSGVRVGDVMSGPPVVADGSLTLDEFIDRLAMTHRFSSYPPGRPRRAPHRPGDAQPGAGGAAGPADRHPAARHRLPAGGGADRTAGRGAAHPAAADAWLLRRSRGRAGRAGPGSSAWSRRPTSVARCSSPTCSPSTPTHPRAAPTSPRPARTVDRRPGRQRPALCIPRLPTWSGQSGGETGRARIASTRASVKDLGTGWPVTRTR